MLKDFQTLARNKTYRHAKHSKSSFVLPHQVMVEGMGRLLVDGSPGNDFVHGAKPMAAWKQDQARQAE